MKRVTTPFVAFDFVRMRFGLCDAVQSFQRILDDVMSALSPIFAYVNDLLVANSTREEHTGHLSLLFGCLGTLYMVKKTGICVFGVPTLEFLGRHLDAMKFYPVSRKLGIIGDFACVISLTKRWQFIRPIRI